MLFFVDIKHAEKLKKYIAYFQHREDKYMLAKPLTIGDMSRSIADVAAELAARKYTI